MFLYHGEEDPVIPVELATLTYKHFEEKAFNFTFKTEPGLVHSLSMNEIKLVSEFLGNLMQ